MERTKIKFTAYSSNKVVQKTPRNGLRASEKICQAEVVYSFKKVQYVQQPPRMILNNLRELRRIEAGLAAPTVHFLANCQLRVLHSEREVCRERGRPGNDCRMPSGQAS